MNITLYEFNSLNCFEKNFVLMVYGVYLSKRVENKVGYSLYQLNDFYVEATYNGGIDAIRKFTAFKSSAMLEPYLDTIDISGV